MPSAKKGAGTYNAYDTMRGGIFTCAQNLTGGQLILAHGTKKRKISKKFKKTD